MKLLCLALLACVARAECDPGAWVKDKGGSISAGGTVIDLTSTWISDTDLERLRPCPIRKLTLAHTRITDAAFQHISELKGLVELDLYYAEFFTDDGFARLKYLPNLEKLSLRGTKVTSKSFETIAKLQNLKELDIAYTQIDDSGVDLLADLPKLERLSIGGNRVGVPAIASMRLFPALRHLDVSGVQRVDSGEWGLPLNEAVLGELGSLKNLQSLNLSGAILTDLGADRPGLKESIRKKLAGLDKLCDAAALESLDLSRQPVDPTDVTDLKKCRHLKELRLAMTPNLSDQAVPVLAALPVQVLDVEGSAITAAGLQELRKLRAAKTSIN